MTFVRGDFVTIRCAGCTVPGMVTLASSNGRSLVVMFEAILDGHVGSMPILQNEAGEYRSLMTGTAVELSANPKP